MGDNALVFGVDIALHAETFFAERACPSIEKLIKVERQCNNAAQNCPALQQTFTSVTQFAKAHVDKVGVAGGLLMSSYLLYKSVTLAGEIEGLFDGIEELKGQYQRQNAQTVLLMQLHEGIRQIIAQQNIDPKAMRKFFRDYFKKSRDFYTNVETLIDAVDDLIHNALKAKTEAEINAGLSALVSILAGFTLVASAPVSMPILLWRTGLALTTGISAGSTVLSLKNSRDAQRAYTKLNILKKHLRQSRRELDKLMEKFMDSLLED